MSMSHYHHREATSSDKQTDWLLYALLAGAVLCLPLTIRATEWFPEANRLFWPVLWAMLLGILLARSTLPKLLSWALGLILGLEYSIQFAAQLLPRLDILVDDTVRAVGWFTQLLGGNVAPPWPFARSATIFWERASLTIANVSSWYQAVQTGAETQDVTVMVLGVVLVTWILVFNAAFSLLRSGKPFVALMPLGAAVVSIVSFTYIGMSYVHAYLAITLFTLIRSNVQRMESFWRRLHLDFSPELRRDASIAGGALASIVLVVALILPYITYDDAVWFFWNNVGDSFMAFYDDLDRAFAGRNPVPSPTPGQDRGLAPHRIGAEGTLGEDVVLMVRTSDPVPPPEEEMEMLGMDYSQFVTKRYWRERTYDEYTGYGWDISTRNTLPMRANEPWTTIEYPHSVVTQTVQVIAPNAGLAFTVNEPVEILDADYRAIVRGANDLAAIEVNETTYTVVSWAPAPSAEQLQAAEDSYPDWVQERFLALPASVPERVRQEAERIVTEAGATTRYEKARAIEAHIRSFEYVLDIEPPSLDRDFVDYFLFDVQAGYCDYSASAMTVMLRSIGVAARYASGYNMGYFDDRLVSWVVSEQNAHAWTEVYFPGYGWVEFEPTPAQTIFERGFAFGSDFRLPEPVGTETEAAPLPLWAWGAGLAALVLLVIVWPPRWFRRKQAEPREVVHQTYDKLVRRARWAGLAPFGGQTPREYLRALAYEMERRADFHGAAEENVRVLENVYLRARYGSGDITEDDSLLVQGAWRRLRGGLLRLVFVRPPREASRAL